jgi:hypothetical protein
LQEDEGQSQEGGDNASQESDNVPQVAGSGSAGGQSIVNKMQPATKA